MKAIINLFKNLISMYRCYTHNRRNNIELLTEYEYNQAIDETKPIIHIGQLVEKRNQKILHLKMKSYDSTRIYRNEMSNYLQYNP